MTCRDVRDSQSPPGIHEERVHAGNTAHPTMSTMWLQADTWKEHDRGQNGTMSVLALRGRRDAVTPCGGGVLVRRWHRTTSTPPGCFLVKPSRLPKRDTRGSLDCFGVKCHRWVRALLVSVTLPPSSTVFQNHFAPERTPFPQPRRTEGSMISLARATTLFQAASSLQARLLVLARCISEPCEPREPRETATSASFWR